MSTTPCSTWGGAPLEAGRSLAGRWSNGIVPPSGSARRPLALAAALGSISRPFQRSPNPRGSPHFGDQGPSPVQRVSGGCTAPLQAPVQLQRRLPDGEGAHVAREALRQAAPRAA